MFRGWKRRLAASLAWCVSSSASGELPQQETLHFRVEWRLITAGRARIEWSGGAPGGHIRLRLESVGLVSKLYKVDDDYTSTLDSKLCAIASFLTAHEGRRHRDTRVAFDHERKKASYIERDLQKDVVLDRKEIDIQPCTQEIMGALYRLRTMELETGQTAQIPVSDGKKSVLVKVVAQQRERIKTPGGEFQAMRYEAHLFNNVLYRRPGRVYIWLAEDRKRTPVQIQVRLQFHIGTITFQLEKEQT